MEGINVREMYFSTLWSIVLQPPRDVESARRWLLALREIIFRHGNPLANHARSLVVTRRMIDNLVAVVRDSGHEETAQFISRYGARTERGGIFAITNLVINIWLSKPPFEIEAEEHMPEAPKLVSECSPLPRQSDQRQAVREGRPPAPEQPLSQLANPAPKPASLKIDAKVAAVLKTSSKPIEPPASESRVAPVADIDVENSSNGRHSKRKRS